LLSASALFLEIVLTRLFSLLYFPPYVFLILSFAILGIALGAALCALRPSLSSEPRLVLYSSGAGLSSLLLILFAALPAAQDLQIVLFILLLIPYLFVGLALSSLFSQYASASRLLYMSDLIGAGIAALLVIPLLNMFGAVNGVLIAALGFAIAGLYFYSKRYVAAVGFSMVLSILSFGGNAAFSLLNIDMSSLASDKPISPVLSAGGEILQTSWDAFARTDLVAPGHDKPLRIYVDGAAASVMPDTEFHQELIRDIGFFPFATEQPQRVYIVGPGAGLDVWFALQSHAKDIVAVEVNPASVAQVEQWGAWNGHLYAQPEVDIIIDEGRSALRRSDTKYDLIYLSQVVTLAAERGGYALSENTIYTVEAFAEYLAHLSEDGQIALKLYDEITLMRAISTALASLRQRGLSDEAALKHLLVLLDDSANPPVPLLLIRNTAYSEDDSLVLGAIARDVGFKPVVLPHVLVQPPLDAVDSGANSFDAIVAASDFDISAPTDDRPYFFQFERGIPNHLRPLALIVAIVTGSGLLGYVWLWLKTSSRIWRYMPAYFAALGMGFIAIEIYAIQQTRLFLGHPTIAVTLVLVTFLVGGGVGSGLSQRFGRDLLEKSPYWITALAVGLLALWSILWQAFSPQLIAGTLIARGIFTVLMLLPLTLCLGIPFPYALGLVAQQNHRLIAVAWSVNGLMTVAGTVISVILSITVGFNAVCVLGGIAYLLATVILFILRTREAVR